MDPSRIADLLDRQADALVLYARQWCDEPEDVVQDAFVKLAGLSEFPLDPPAWLFRTVRNRAINAGIARRRRLRHETKAAVAVAPWFESDPSARGVGDIDPEIAQEALASLPIEQREIIVAHLWGGLTFAQIAELAGISSSSTHRLYHAGLSTLRERLGVACRKNT